MKRKILFLLLLITLVTPTITGCGYHSEIADIENVINDETSLLKPTGINKALYYDTNTLNVYIIYNETYEDGDSLAMAGYMSAYFAPNGKPYLFIDGKLVENNK